MSKKKLTTYILERSYPEFFSRLFERLVPESQLDTTPDACKHQFFNDQNQSLAASIKFLSIFFSIVWATTYATDNIANILGKTIFFRAYFQVYLAVLVIACFKGFFDSKTITFNRNVLFFSFFQVCLFQGLITHYSKQSTVLFVMIVNSIVSSLAQANCFQLFTYLIMSNGVYFLISGDLSRMVSGPEVSFLASALLFQAAMLILPCTYLYQKTKSFVALYTKDLALREAFDLTLKISEKTSTFLSQNHKDRINYATSILKLDYPQAFDLVTKIKKRPQIVILFQDIRAFTSTMRSSPAAEETIKIMMSLSAEKIDHYWGNASDKGDLILAFFDEASIEVQINLALLSAFMLNEVTQTTNANSLIKIRRYPVLTLASCSTGNVASNRKRLIDAKGEAANLAARIDELTKSPGLKTLIESHDIVLDSHFYQQMNAIHPTLEVTAIYLEDYSLKIRDFEEMTHIYVIKGSDHNNAYMNTAIKNDVDHILRNKQEHLFKYFNALRGDIQRHE